MKAPAWLLKSIASTITLGAAYASAVYIGGHVYNAAAPLHPAVVGGVDARSPVSNAPLLTPSIRVGSTVNPVTSTYAS